MGRALAIPYNKVDQVAKLVPFSLGMTLDTALKQSRELRERVGSDPQVGELFDMARKVEGMPRHASTHAAGVVITDKPVMDYVPLSKNDDAVVTQYTMTAIEELGLLKMDFLGLRNLSVIDHAEKLIRRREPGFSAAGSARGRPGRLPDALPGELDGRVPAGIPGDEAAADPGPARRRGGPYRHHLPVPAGAHAVYPPIPGEPQGPCQRPLPPPACCGLFWSPPAAASSTRSR